MKKDEFTKALQDLSIEVTDKTKPIRKKSS